MSRIAILGGESKGRVLSDARGPDTRIATAALRTSLFDILKPRIEGARLLDLFAGVGSLGLEGLSRGASFGVFVEKDPRCLQALRKNVETLGYEERARVVKLDAFDVSEGGPYDIVFIDPPYRFFDSAPLRAMLQGLLARLRAMVKGGGLVVLKHARGKGIGVASDVRRYGDTELSFFEIAA